MSIKVIIADDHKLIRQGIVQLLEFDNDIEIVGQAKDGVECLSLINKIPADVLLLDINMPKKNGIEVLQSLKNKRKKIKVLILTIHNETEYLIKAVDIGVNGYILKDSGFDELKNAIHIVHEGESYIQPSLIPALNSRLVKRDVEKEKIELLSKREMGVLILVAQGFSNRDIAKKLEISERTVKNHLSNIFKKIQVADRTQAAVFAIRNNLIQIF
jgi:two-component system, NarL family, response regulator DegU